MNIAGETKSMIEIANTFIVTISDASEFLVWSKVTFQMLRKWKAHDGVLTYTAPVALSLSRDRGRATLSSSGDFLLPSTRSAILPANGSNNTANLDAEHQKEKSLPPSQKKKPGPHVVASIPIFSKKGAISVLGKVTTPRGKNSGLTSTTPDTTFVGTDTDFSRLEPLEISRAANTENTTEATGPTTTELANTDDQQTVTNETDPETKEDKENEKAAPPVPKDAVEPVSQSEKWTEGEPSPSSPEPTTEGENTPPNVDNSAVASIVGPAVNHRTLRDSGLGLSSTSTACLDPLTLYSEVPGSRFTGSDASHEFSTSTPAASPVVPHKITPRKPDSPASSPTITPRKNESPKSLRNSEISSLDTEAQTISKSPSKQSDTKGSQSPHLKHSSLSSGATLSRNFSGVGLELTSPESSSLTSSECTEHEPPQMRRDNAEFANLLVHSELERRIQAPDFPSYLEGAFVTLSDDSTLKLWSLQTGVNIPQISYPEPLEPRNFGTFKRSSPSPSPTRASEIFLAAHISASEGKDGSSGDGCSSNEDSESNSTHSFGNPHVLTHDSNLELTPTKRKLFAVSGIKKRMVSSTFF